MKAAVEKSLWELLWDYDPNGLVAVDSTSVIRVVNASFCRMFHASGTDVVGRPAADVLPDAEELLQIWREKSPVVARERHYPMLDLYVRQVIFTIPQEGLLGCIMVDLTEELRQRNELAALRQQTIDHVNQVVNNQMRVAQEIARLLGETTAQSKVSLLKLIKTIEREPWSNGE